jgi:hypothetical protein
VTGVKKARRLFQQAGLPFPTIPDELAERLKEQGKWLFSTREIDMSPYNLRHYVQEVEGTHVEDYVILSHSGHGVNSYGLQYYVVYGTLRLFLHLGWGGAYMDKEADAKKIRDCFLLVDEIVATARDVGRVPLGGRLLVVGSDFYGSYWLPPGKIRRGPDEAADDHKAPAEVLAEVRQWLRNPQ